MQRSKLVDAIHFLVEPNYKGYDMSTFTVNLEYKLPISKEYHSEILTLSPELYKEKLEYVLPLDTSLTKEFGEVELQLTFSTIEMGEDGVPIQRVRKTTPTNLTITPIAAWSDMIPDAALTSIDQRLLMIDAMMKQLSDIAEVLDKSKADNLSLEGQTLQLTSNGQKIGDPKDLGGQTPADDSGMKVVEF